MNKLVSKLAVLITALSSLTFTSCATDMTNTCGSRTIITRVIRVDPPQPPQTVTVVTKYICTKCDKEFVPTKDTPYCTACAPKACEQKTEIVMRPFTPIPPTPVVDVVIKQPPVVVQQQQIIIQQTPQHTHQEYQSRNHNQTIDLGGYYINIPLPPGASGIFQNRVWVPSVEEEERSRVYDEYQRQLDYYPRRIYR